jgi:hypothetical protein
MSIVKLNNKAVSNATVIGSISSLGSMTFIKKLTASSSATLSFVDGTDGVVLDDTYKEYYFTFNNIHPATDAAFFTFQANAAGGSGYNETITSTMFVAYHEEDGSDSGLAYATSGDQANGTAFQEIARGTRNEADDNCSGYLHLFNPSSTTFVKHYMACANTVGTAESDVYHTAGYFNTTSAIDEIQFKMDSGNIDAGDICLYGIA